MSGAGYQDPSPSNGPISDERANEPLSVLTLTRPLLPRLDDLVPYLADILQRRWITNNGKYVRQLEEELGTYLDVDDVVAITNATMGLDLVIRELLPEGGEVITTGYSFPATYHVLLNNPKIKPVFADIDANYGLDPHAVEECITSRTQAILAVHTYGYPCDHDKLRQIANRHGVYLIYDAAPAFGVKVSGSGVATLGDAAVFSFHATKVFNTVEGGCVTSGSQAAERFQERMRLWRNFGIRNEEEIALFGVNAKLDEIRAVFGLLNLKLVEEAFRRRKVVVDHYLSYFNALSAPDVRICTDLYARQDLTLNYAYFPILIHPTRSFDRDAVYSRMRQQGILSRKYFYPVITDSHIYRGLYDPAKLPRTTYASRNVLCLPVHHEMTETECESVIAAFESVYKGTH